MKFKVQHISGKGFTVVVKAEDEYEARAIVAGNNNNSPKDYMAWEVK